MISLFGDSINDLKYFWFQPYKLGNINLIISRTGWSSELGYEIFLLDSSQGDDLYEALMSTGKVMGLKPGHTSTIRRIEGAMLSYHADMDINTNPFELGLDKFIDIDAGFDFIGKTALKKILKNGIKRKQVGLIINSEPLKGPNTRFWDVKINEKHIGKITSAVYSPRLKQNIALAIISIEHAIIGNEVLIDHCSNISSAIIVEKPFHDSKKALAKN